MAEPLADRVIRRIGQAAELYHRLVMLVAPAGAGKTAALQYDRFQVIRLMKELMAENSGIGKSGKGRKACYIIAKVEQKM